MSRHVHVTIALVLGLTGVLHATSAAAQDTPDDTARYGFTRPMGAMGTSPVAARSELGAGVNIYFHRHALKLQLDVFHLWADAPEAQGAAFETGEQRVRVMLQASL